jgi:co-chaperonin GroES (HSP10)
MSKKISLCQDELGLELEVKSYFILIRSPKFSRKTKSGLFIGSDGEIAKIEYACNLGKVLKCGADAFKGEQAKQFEVKPGDWVWYNKFERQSIWVSDKSKINDHNLYNIPDMHVLNVCQEKDLPKILGIFFEEKEVINE